MQVDVDALLSGPRGRRLLLEFVLGPQGQDSPEGAWLWQRLFYSTYRLERARGHAVTLFGPAANEPVPDPSLEEIAGAVDAVPLRTVDDTRVLLALAASVDAARYWQAPDGADELLHEGPMRRTLERVADRIAGSPVVSWWTAPVSGSQWIVAFDGLYRPDGDPPPSATAVMQRWADAQPVNERQAERERPTAPEANYGGEWWSTPPSGLSTSTRALPHLGPVGLWLVEDSMGWPGATVHRIRQPHSSRVYEITGADTWAHLCREYPLEVTASRRHDWYRTTGRSGRWVIPDWSRVSGDFDAVHLTVAAYLTCAGVSIAIDADSASVIAGWNPDQIYWLTDVVIDDATSTHWTLNTDTRRWSDDRVR